MDLRLHGPLPPDWNPRDPARVVAHLQWNGARRPAGSPRAPRSHAAIQLRLSGAAPPRIIADTNLPRARGRPRLRVGALCRLLPAGEGHPARHWAEHLRPALRLQVRFALCSIHGARHCHRARAPPRAASTPSPHLRPAQHLGAPRPLPVAQQHPPGGPRGAPPRGQGPLPQLERPRVRPEAHPLLRGKYPRRGAKRCSRMHLSTAAAPASRSSADRSAALALRRDRLRRATLPARCSAATRARRGGRSS